MEFDTALVKLLMEVGYLATGNGFSDEARTIFRGVAAARPESEYPLIGLAVVEMNEGNLQEAVRLLEKARKLNPESWLAASFMGLAYKLSGETTKSRAVLEEVVARAKDATAVSMARALLAEMS